MTSPTARILRGLLCALVFALTAACDHGAGAGAPDPEMAAELRRLPVPEEFQAGEALFNRECVTCHGDRALGTDQGPPLVHIVYEPRHHADIAFQLAVRQGVRAHHFGFGDMPPIPGLEPADVGEITAYVRWLQRQAGIH